MPDRDHCWVMLAASMVVLYYVVELGANNLVPEAIKCTAAIAKRDRKVLMSEHTQ